MTNHQKVTAIPTRIGGDNLPGKIITAAEAAGLITSGMTVATSGFTKSGDSKAVLPALAERAGDEAIRINLLTGASLGQGTDGALAQSGALQLRLPFQSDPVMRKLINRGEIEYIDENLSETAAHLRHGFLPDIDVAIIEAVCVKANGDIVPTTSVGNSAVFVQLAKKVIIEINEAMPLELEGLHDIFLPSPGGEPGMIPLTTVDGKIGQNVIVCDPGKIVGIVLTNKKDSPADIAPTDAATEAIASHILRFLEKEVASGKMTQSLRPIQAGIGKVANAVLTGFVDSAFENLTMYSEVLQDSAIALIDAGKVKHASASSITVSDTCYQHIFDHFENYRDKITLRPQDVTNAPEVVQRLGVIAINTAVECDLYGNVNSSHIGGTHIVNGIGGSADFAQNSYLSIFVTESICSGGNISRIVPMVTHTDHSEHDVDVIVTEQGLADLRGLSPRKKAEAMIRHCVHPDYRISLEEYFHEACDRGGQTPHVLEKAFEWHLRLRQTGSMKAPETHEDPYCNSYFARIR